jgi:hypothetical protein
LRRGSGEPSRPRMKSLGGVFEERKKRTFVADRLDKDLGITAAYRAVMTRRISARRHALFCDGIVRLSVFRVKRNKLPPGGMLGTGASRVARLSPS